MLPREPCLTSRSSSRTWSGAWGLSPRVRPVDRPAARSRRGPAVLDPSGEAFLERVFNAYRSATSESGTNVWNTALLIGWDEPGGTYDHVAPGPVPPPDPDAPAGEFGFTFDRSGYRVPRSSSRLGSSRGRFTTRSTGIRP